MKIYRRVGTLVMIGLLILAAVGFAAMQKNSDAGSIFGPVKQQKDWKAGQEKQIAENKKIMKEKGLPEDFKDSLKEENAIRQHRIDHDIPPNHATLWGFMSRTDGITPLVTLLTVIVGATSVAGEFSWGTIKLLLIRSARRSKILLAKYIATLGFAIAMLLLLFLVSLVVGLILYGADGLTSPYLTYTDGKVVEKNMIGHIFTLYGLKSINLLMMVTFAFMISTVFRSSSVAIGAAIFLMFAGTTLVGILAANGQDWAKYLLFANTDLNPYFDGEPLFKGMTLFFSVTVLAVYFTVFNAISWIFFNKQDVAS
ncbi:ABC transporter permease [Salinithrix halophila]|uniref:ABC transporter permease n=2 Tax=Salinithrix halophila TaxID=1485204 RepID=A0ABV8JDW6_9BACL